MNEQEMQQQFILWLKKKKGAATDTQVKTLLQELQANPEMMQQTIEEFQADMAGGQPVMKHGGRVSYIECLKQFKKGGIMDCDCNKVARGEKGVKTFRRSMVEKQVPKAQLGMLTSKAATLAPKLAGLGKSSVKATLGQKALGFLGANKNKIAGTALKGVEALGSIKSKSDQQVITPSPKNDYYGANAGAINSPTMKPLQRQVPVFTGNDIPPGGITATKLVEKGAKLKKHLEGGILFADKGARMEKREARQDRRAERRLNRRDNALVREYNYSGEEASPGVFERPRNRFDEGAEAMIRAKQPLQASASSLVLPVSRPLLSTISEATRPSGEKVVSQQAPGNNYDSMSFGAALKAARKSQGSGTFTWRGKQQRISSVEEDEAAAKALQQKSKGIAPPVKGISQPTTGPIARQIRVPNPQYPGSTTIMPGTGIGEVEVTAPNLHKKATITPQEQEAIWKMREAKGLHEGANAPSPEIIVRSGSVIPTPGYRPPVEGAPLQQASPEDIKWAQGQLKSRMYDKNGVMRSDWAKKSSGKAELTDSPIDYLAGPAGIEFLGTTVLKAAPRALGMGTARALGTGAAETIVPSTAKAAIGAGQLAIGAGQTALKEGVRRASGTIIAGAGKEATKQAVKGGQKALMPKTATIREMLLRQ